MATKKKLLQAAAGSAGGGGLNVEDVFSTYLYYPTGNTHTVTNGIDLSGEGGLVWLKNRLTVSNHELADTERGVTKKLSSNSTAAEDSLGDLSAFNSDGFSLTANNGNAVYNTAEVASWTFRKAPKFFDVVTYTGNGSTQNISHNLGSVPGSIIIKELDNSAAWRVYHRSLGNTKALFLNTTSSQSVSTTYWNDTDPTDSVFTVGNNSNSNENGVSYVAYLFAHNDGDGEFGPDGDADIIKCGSYTGTGSSGKFVDLGFEPQWLLIKRSSGVEDWMLFDNMRGIPTGGIDTDLRPNISNAENNFYDWVDVNATGFTLKETRDHVNGSGSDYIYIAIRRGPMAVPEDADDVFAVDNTQVTTAPNFTSGFPVDFALMKSTTGSNTNVMDRLRQGTLLKANLTDAESSNTLAAFDFQDGFAQWTNTASRIAWMWRRAPNYFDVVAYTGNGTLGRTVSHNLGVAPEMIWIKGREDTENWRVFHSGLPTPEDDFLYLNTTNATVTNVEQWNSTLPTSTEFSLSGQGRGVNDSNESYIAYLFASLDGVSKVGSFSHTNGTATNVDCGFSNGARFVLLKRYNSTGSWVVLDSARGITTGNDPWLILNGTDAEYTTYDVIDPYSSGFTVGASFLATGNWIFYAIA